MADQLPLDELYRPRTSSGLSDVLPGEHRLEQGTDDGITVRVDVWWPHKTESHLRMDCTRATVNFLRLDSHRQGLYGDLVERLPRFFKLRGVEAFLMQPAGDESRGRLLERGRWQLVDNTYRWEL